MGSRNAYNKSTQKHDRILTSNDHWVEIRFTLRKQNTEKVVMGAGIYVHRDYSEFWSCSSPADTITGNPRFESSRILFSKKRDWKSFGKVTAVLQAGKSQGSRGVVQSQSHFPISANERARDVWLLKKIGYLWVQNAPFIDGILYVGKHTHFRAKCSPNNKVIQIVKAFEAEMRVV